MIRKKKKKKIKIIIYFIVIIFDDEKPTSYTHTYVLRKSAPAPCPMAYVNPLAGAQGLHG